MIVKYRPKDQASRSVCSDEWVSLSFVKKIFLANQRTFDQGVSIR